MAEKTLITPLGTVPEYQEYNPKDLNLIQQFQLVSNFGKPEDYIEYYIYDLNSNLLFSNPNSINYKLGPQGSDPTNDTSTYLILSPEQDVRAYGIDRGSVNITYYFYKSILGSSLASQYWIKEISSDRTELKVVSQLLGNEAVLTAAAEYQTKLATQSYYYDYLLNFGNNQTIIGVNLLPSIDEDGDVVLLVKLYEPLPSNFGIKSTFWFVEKLNEPQSYNIVIEVISEVVDTTPRLRGPNFSIKVNEQINQTTGEYNYEDLFDTSVSSSYQQIKSLMDEKGIEINVDYTNFSNFIHFSSITDRLYNFQYKLQLIESYSADLITLDNVVQTGNTGIIGSTKEVIQSKINNVIQKFDGYEYYLYFESGTYAWPKSTNKKPYTLYSVTSSQAIGWMGGSEVVPTTSSVSMLYSASRYDNSNKDLFINTIPSYLLDDSENLPYEVFLNMVGQHFDNIWIYLKDVTEKFNANSSLTRGISKDLVADALKGFGINLYTNTNISDNLYYSILGYNADGSLLPPTGSEKIQYYVTSSESTMAAEDITLEYYKRLYHNLPYLLKTKGTERGVRALISCYGIPDTVLRVNEYGGVPKTSNYTGYKQSRFSLAYENNYTSSLAFPWAPSYYNYLRYNNANLVPDAIEFRFKTKGIPDVGYYSQSLFQVGSGTNLQFGINLVYNPNADIPTSSYQDYGNVSLFINSGGISKSSPIHLPFFNKDLWWTVLLQRSTPGHLGAGTDTFTLYVKNAYYNEEGISRVGFEGSASISISSTPWNTFNPTVLGSFNAYLGGTVSNNVLSPNNSYFNGYFQEFRYWAAPLDETTFDRHVLNSLDYSWDTTTGSLFELMFRAPLGNDLNVPYRSSTGTILNSNDYSQYLLGQSTINTSAVIDTIHPAVSGSFFVPEYGAIVQNIQSFINGSIYGYGTFSTGNNRLFRGQDFVDLVTVPVTGISQKINNKVILDTVITGSYPVETTLTTQTSVQRYDTDRTLTSPDVEIAFSPGEVISDDIMNQLGAFNIDNYIGGTSDQYSSSYASLESLKNLYFTKYVNKFNTTDFIRAIKYIDNSLFKMLRDFTPAKANLSTGVVIKPHILERSKYQRYEPTFTRIEYTGSIDTAFITGSTPQGENYETAYSYSVETTTGPVNKLYPNYLAQYTGEFSGSKIQAVSPVFLQKDVSNVKPINTQSLSVNRQSWYYVTYSLDPLLNNISESRKSTRYYDVDYSSDQILPVNFSLIQYAISQSQAGNTQYNDQYIPWAKIQDSNYQSKSYTVPRYSGSRTVSKLYSTYSVGDQSYGKTAAIDKERFQYVYLVDIYTASLTLPGRSNAQIKYLLNNTEAVLDLTKENNNIFDIQNIFKGGEKINISLFDYTDQSTNVLTNKSVELYEGGFRYLPILHNLSGSTEPNVLKWILPEPIEITTVIPGTSTTATPCTSGNPTKWSNPVNYAVSTVQYDGNTKQFNFRIQYVGGFTSDLPENCQIQLTIRVTNSSLCNTYINTGFTVYGQLSRNSYGLTDTFYVPCYCEPNTGDPTCQLGDVKVTDISAVSSTSSTTTTTPDIVFKTYTTSSALGNPCLKLANTTISEYRNRLIQFDSQDLATALRLGYNIVFDGNSDPLASGSNIEPVVVPFTLAAGDAIHFYTSSLGWSEKEEYRVVTAFRSGAINNDYTNERLYAVLDRSVNRGVLTEPTTSLYDTPICKYIVAKHIPDETNLILRYNPIDPNLIEEGLIYPQYILETVRKNAGNVIKSLKSQGLI